MRAWTLPSVLDRPVVVVGGGVLGRRIACVWAGGGYEVNIYDPSAEKRAGALHYIDNNVDKYAAYAASTPKKARALADLDVAVENAWFVVEAVPENMKLKIDTFGRLDANTPADCILASSSTSYKCREMLEKVSQEGRKRILNVHYMMPPDNHVVELMIDVVTHSDIAPFLVSEHKKVGMYPVVALKESDGFVVSRVWAAVKHELLAILSEGVSIPADLDAVWVEMFRGMNAPCAMMDGIGLDTVAVHEQQYVAERHLTDTHTLDYLRKNYLEQGRLGAKSSNGGLYPPGHTTKTKGEDIGHHDNLHAPTLYFLDIGLSHAPSEAMHGGRVLVGYPDGRPTRTLVEGEVLPDGIDVSLVHDRIYWTSMGIPDLNDGCVKSCQLDGSDIVTIVGPGAVHTPKQIVIDHAAAKLYFSDREGLRVHRCNLDGSAHEILIKTGDWHDKTAARDQANWCVGITLSPKERKFYWTQKGPSKGFEGRILRANIDMPPGADASTRSDVETLFISLPEPIDLEIEPESSMLYWSDRGELPTGNSLNRISLHELGRLSSTPTTTKKTTAKENPPYEILARNLHEAIGVKLDLINQHIYSTDLGGCVYRFGMDGGDRRKLYEDQGSFSGIALVHL